MTQPLRMIAWIEAMLAAIERNDTAEIKSLIHPDFVMYEDAGMPYGGVFHGPDGFFKMQQAVYGSWRDMSLERMFVLEEPGGDTVSVTYRFRARPQKSDDFVETFLHETWTIRNGLAIEAYVWYWNTPYLAKALGQ